MKKAENIYENIPGVNPELEAKLELLHNCMQYETPPPELSPLLKEFEGAYKKFLEVTESKSLLDADKIYIHALREFRDLLLGS